MLQIKTKNLKWKSNQSIGQKTWVFIKLVRQKHVNTKDIVMRWYEKRWTNTRGINSIVSTKSIYPSFSNLCILKKVFNWKYWLLPNYFWMILLLCSLDALFNLLSKLLKQRLPGYFLHLGLLITIHVHILLVANCTFTYLWMLMQSYIPLAYFEIQCIFFFLNSLDLQYTDILSVVLSVCYQPCKLNLQIFM